MICRTTPYNKHIPGSYTVYLEFSLNKSFLRSDIPPKKTIKNTPLILIFVLVTSSYARSTNYSKMLMFNFYIQISGLVFEYYQALILWCKITILLPMIICNPSMTMLSKLCVLVCACFVLIHTWGQLLEAC